MGHVQALEPIDDDVVIEELALHELPEAAADLVLPVRDDRRVRDRDPERMAEQRVTANQSASAPIIAASAKART